MNKHFPVRRELVFEKICLHSVNISFISLIHTRTLPTMFFVSRSFSSAGWESNVTVSRALQFHSASVVQLMG